MKCNDESNALSASAITSQRSDASDGDGKHLNCVHFESDTHTDTSMNEISLSSIIPSNRYLIGSKDPTQIRITKSDSKTEGDGSFSEIEFVDTGMARQSLTFSFRHSDLPDPYVQDFTFGWFDKLTGVISIILFFVDVGTDINLAITYFKMCKWWWAAETTFIVVVPSLIICCLGLQWYIIDYQKEKQIQASRCVWFLRIFFTLLQCGPVIRTIEYLHYGSKSRDKDIDPERRYLYYRYMLRQSLDICLLHLFESFFEAAPQLAIQIYIMIAMKPDQNFLHSSVIALSLLTSWSSLGISLTSYNKSLRINKAKKTKMSLKSVPFYFVWRASEVGGRILCIAMFASVFKLWVFLVLGLHWMVMSLWLIEQKTQFYKNRCSEIAFNLLCGYVMIFCFLNLREGHTRCRFLIFYCVIYIENFIMLAFWFRFTSDLGAWFHLWGFVAVLLLFAVHVIFQLLYYVIFHPTKNIKMCLPCDRYSVYTSMCSDVSPQAENRSKILDTTRTTEEETLSQATINTAV